MMAGRSQPGSGLWSLAALALASALFAAPSTALAATCTVTSTADYNPTTDPVITNTLRWCVEVIGNNDSTATAVGFNFTSGSGPWEIDLEYFLHITEADTTIDGSTQSGYTSVTPSSSGSYGVILDGSTNISAPLILIDGTGAEIRALRIKDHEAAAPPGPPPHAIQVAANGATIAQNRIEDCSGGVAVFEDVQNTLIGGSSSTEGNVIAATTNSDGIILIEVGTGNVVQHNVIDQAYGSGIFALESAVSTGLAALITIDDNTVTYSGGDGYVIFDSRASLEGNYSDYNTGAGFVLADFADVTDRMLVRDNYSRSNGADGVAVLGAEVSLWNNVVTGNGGLGVALATMLGDDTSPDGTGPDDDTVAGGVIGSDTISGDRNTVQSNTVGGIALFDATIDNVASVDLDNDLGSNGDFEVVQMWPGVVQLHDAWDAPIADADVEIWPTGGPDPEDEPLESGITDSEGYAGPTGTFVYDDVETWFEIPSFVVFDEGSGPVRFDAWPHEVRAKRIGVWKTLTYSWDGSSLQQPGGSTKNSCIDTSGQCRYQVAGLEAGLQCPSGPQCTSESVGSRDYWLCVPDSLPGGDRPLVIGLHGFGTGPEEFAEGNGGCRMNELAELYGFITAYPAARRVAGIPRWDDCRSITPDPLFGSDVSAMVSIVEDIQLSESVDAERIYAWGASNGGMMTQRLVAELAPDAFGGSASTPALAAAAALIANEPAPHDPENQTGNSCSYTEKPRGDLLFMQGDTDDYWMPYGGGWIASLDPHDPDPDPVPIEGAVRAMDVALGAVESTLDWWQNTLDVAASSSGLFEFKDAREEGAGDPDIDDGSSVTVETFGDWDSGPLVRFYHVEGGGHEVPGTSLAELFVAPEDRPREYCDTEVTETTGLFRLGCANQDIIGVDEVWRFFQKRTFRDQWEDTNDDAWDAAGWSGHEGDGTELDISAAAAMGPSSQAGLIVDPASASDEAYLVRTYSSTQKSLRFRFWVDPNPTGATYVPGTSWWSLLAALRPGPEGNRTFSHSPFVDPRDSALVIGLWIGGSRYGLEFYARDDSGDYVYWSGGSLEIASSGSAVSSPHLVEVTWRAASAPGADDGFLCMERIDHVGAPDLPFPEGLDDPRQGCATGIDNDQQAVDRFLLGAINAGMQKGPVYIDGFEEYTP